MKIGDTEITREDMPAQLAWQYGNPDHIRQGFQDILNARLSQQPVLQPQQDTGQMDTAQQNSTWK